MKVALVQCPVWGTREPPLAVVQLSACVKSRGFEAYSFDLNNFLYRNRADNMKNLWAWEQSLFWYNREEVAALFGDIAPVLEAYADRVLAKKPDVIGFSVAASSYHAGVEFAKLLRRKGGNVRIVFGGTVFHDERYVRRAFEEAPVDYVIAGEADVTFPELAAFLDAGKDVSGCAGIHLRKDGAVHFTGERPLLQDLDSLPYMDFTDLKADDYDDSEHVSIMSSRGCVWKCAFCSSRAFWDGYRSMSGERIHQEVTYHRARNPKIGHIDFFDLAFNGDMEKVLEFSRLMVAYPPYDPHFKIQWVANAIISPRLDKESLALMKAAGCQRLIFGIESGSERVLELMHKKYRPEVAVRVIRDAHEAGIKVTCNFMFGFPGETEEDFRKTLDFVRSIAGYVERVYPSRTYCALEEYSYFHKNPAEYGIKTPVNHHLYWESVDGTNTYPVRLERCRRFEQLCEEAGVRIDCGVRTSVELDNWYSLGMYYEFKGDHEKVLECYQKYLAIDPHNKLILDRVRELLGKSGVPGRWKEEFSKYFSEGMPS